MSINVQHSSHELPMDTATHLKHSHSLKLSLKPSHGANGPIRDEKRESVITWWVVTAEARFSSVTGQFAPCDSFNDSLRHWECFLCAAVSMRGSWDGYWALTDIREYVNVDVFFTCLLFVPSTTHVSIKRRFLSNRGSLPVFPSGVLGVRHVAVNDMSGV